MVALVTYLLGMEVGVGVEVGVGWGGMGWRVTGLGKLQALVYDILPSLGDKEKWVGRKGGWIQN